VAAVPVKSYRHIDTAEMYGNEKGVGEAIADSGIPRDELYVTSKLNNGFHRPDDARRAFDQTLTDLGLDQIDLYLIHWPLPSVGRYVDTWRAFVHLREEGLVRSIGVSNFTPDQIEQIVEATGVWPAVNQIELHPEFAQPRLREWHAAHGIAIESWRPLGRGVLDRPAIERIAAAHRRTPAQVVLRWHIQRGDIIFPKSVTPARMRENFALFDFELTDEDMAAVDGLDRGEKGRTGPNPDEFDYIPS